MGTQNFEFVYSESLFVIADAAAAIRDYASQGYDLVIAHGVQYGTSLAEIAPDFPDTSFAWGSTMDTMSDQGIDNIFAYYVHAEQGGYVLGVLAARLTRSGVIGIIGPIDAGDPKLSVGGARAAIAKTKPKARLNVNWTGSFSDMALAATAARDAHRRGRRHHHGSRPDERRGGRPGAAEPPALVRAGLRPDLHRPRHRGGLPGLQLGRSDQADDRPHPRQRQVRGGRVMELDLANRGIQVVVNPRATVPRGLVEDTVRAIVQKTITIDVE